MIAGSKILAARLGAFFVEHPKSLLLLVLVEVELLTAGYHIIFEPDRLWFELAMNGASALIVALPVIALVLGQHGRLRQISAELERLNATDRMTGVLNRQSFMERLAPMLESVRPGESGGAFAYLDADFFKQLNDRFGHATGDKALLMIADIMRNSVRTSDLCARLGGEEFGIFLKGANLEEAAIVADRIRQRVATDSSRDISLPPVSVSIGIAAHHAGMPLDTLMNEADRSLYVAKQQGRDTVVVELKKYMTA